MIYKLFGKFSTNMLLSKQGVKFTFGSSSDDLLKNISSIFGLDYIKFKHFLLEGEKDKITEKIKNTVIQSTVFKNLIENCKNDNLTLVVYSSGLITVKGKMHNYIFLINKSKLVMILNY